MSARILVVDDERDVVDLISFLLTKDGYEVIPAYNGREALGCIAEQLPALVILDIMMPEIDGYTVHTRLLESERTRHLPVVILTAKGQMRDLFAMASNVAAYIEKPFDPKALRGKVREILDSR